MVPHRPTGLVRHLEPWCFEQLIASLDASSPRGLRDRAIIWCIARLGLRAGEVAGDDGLHVVIERVTTGPAPEVLESRELGVLPAVDPERAARLADLRTLARDRAALLNHQARQA